MLLGFYSTLIVFIVLFSITIVAIGFLNKKKDYCEVTYFPITIIISDIEIIEKQQ